MLLAQPPLDLLPVFNAQPGATLLLSPDWVIVGASDDYLAATLTRRDMIVGQHIFDAFPDNPETPEANAVANVRASLQRVMATKQPHEMAPQHYDVPDPAQPGRFVERHWQPRHTPALDAQGQVQFIIQSVQDITASRQAERQLRESEAAEQTAHAVAEQQRHRFLEVLTQMSAYIAVYQGPDHIYQFVNPAYQNLFPHRSFLGRPFREGTPEAIELGVVALFDQVYQTGEPVYLREMEGWFDFHGNGQPVQVFLNISLHPLRNVQGHIDGVLDFTYDVSEQVRARQQLEQLNQELETRVQQRSQQALALQADLLAAAQRQVQARETFYQAFEQTPAAICIQRGPAHHYEYANQAYRDFFPGRPLIGQPVAEALPETVDSGIVALLDRVYQTGETYNGVELPLLVAQPKGPPRQMYFTFTYQALRENGAIVGISTFAYNVAEQVHARGELERQGRRLREVFEQAPVAICVFAGPDYVLEVVNPPMGEMLGHPASELVGRPFFAALPELKEQGLRELLDQVRQTGNPYYAREQQIRLSRHGQGGSGYYNFTYQPLRDTQEQVTAVTCVATDVTEQVLARQQVQDLNQELAAINEEMQATNEELLDTNTRLTRTNADLDTFVYAASHDLKAPIANIEGLLNALREYLPTEAQEPMVPRLVGMMEGAITRFQQTVSHLTDVSHLQVGRYSQSVEYLDIPRALEDVRLDLLPLLESTHAELVVSVEACPNVRFSANNLRSVLFNLLSNAVKYRAPDRTPVVQIRTHCTPRQVVVEIQDNGLGLSNRQQGQLFTMFRRLHAHVEGSGVGLYLIKRLIENAGGTLTVASQLGIGSTFNVTLPRV